MSIISMHLIYPQRDHNLLCVFTLKILLSQPAVLFPWVPTCKDEWR